MKHIIGIDLGTTYSAIATLDALGKPSVVPNFQGERLTPSVIAFDEADAPDMILVGQEAKNLRDLQPANVVTEIKRDMGEPGRMRKFRGKEFSPEDLAALIVSKLSKDASSQLGKLDDAVITVPAYFAEPHRRATMLAGELAGLRVKAIVNEPTAAALLYATNHDIRGKVVVFDLGGGTFDVTVMDVAGRKVDIVASEGDRHLGGVDFDGVIAEIVDRKFRDKFEKSYFAVENERASFMNEAEKIKKALSQRQSTQVMLSSSQGRIKVEIAREEFEEGISPLVAKAEMLVEAVLDEAGIEPGGVAKVLLVGGSSRIPFVQRRLESIFGFAPVTEVNLDEAVACGAAIHSGLTSLEENAALVPAGVRAGLADIKLTDAVVHSFGVIVMSRDQETGQDRLHNDIIIPRGTPLPVSATRMYYTIADGQEKIEVKITQGESDDPDHVSILYKEHMELPRNRPANRPIDVKYSYNTNMTMECTFKDVESGEVFEVELTPSEGGMTGAAKRKRQATLKEFQID